MGEKRGTKIGGGKHVRLDPFRTAVPFWGKTTRTLSGLPPKRNCGPEMAQTNEGDQNCGRCFPPAVYLWHYLQRIR